MRFLGRENIHGSKQRPGRQFDQRRAAKAPTGKRIHWIAGMEIVHDGSDGRARSKTPHRAFCAAFFPCDKQFVIPPSLQPVDASAGTGQYFFKIGTSGSPNAAVSRMGPGAPIVKPLEFNAVVMGSQTADKGKSPPLHIVQTAVRMIIPAGMSSQNDSPILSRNRS